MSRFRRLLVAFSLGLATSVFAPPLAETGLPTDLAIDGPGWFAVRDPQTGEFLYERRGDFRLDSNGFLVNSIGQRVQGFCDLGKTIIGDVMVNDTQRPAIVAPVVFMISFLIETNGDVRLRLSDNSEYVRAQILLQDFEAPEELERVSHHLHLATPTARLRGPLTAPGTQGLGRIVNGALEIAPTPPRLRSWPPAGTVNAIVSGVITRTAVPTDLAIRGRGFFIVRDPVTAELFATRAGAFLWDSNNFLITYDRKRVQGRLAADPSTIGDVRIDRAQATPYSNPLAEISAVSFVANGDVLAYLADGTSFNAARVQLWSFDYPDRLAPVGLAQYDGVVAAVRREITNFGSFSVGGTRLESGLELINVSADLVKRRHELSWFPQGVLERTGNPTDLAISGPGFFLLRDVRTHQQVVTRDGRFHFDARGFLVSRQGLRVQGRLTETTGRPQDVRIDWHFRPPGTATNASLAAYSISRDGRLDLCYSDGTQFFPGAVMLMTFGESFRLRPVGHRLYSGLEAAVPHPLASASSGGTGFIECSAIELPPEPESIALPPRNGFRFEITGEPGSRWTIEATEDFLTWQTVGVITNAPFESEFCDVSAWAHLQRSYRVLADYPPPPTNRFSFGPGLWNFQSGFVTNGLVPVGTNLSEERPQLGKPSRRTRPRH